MLTAIEPKVGSSSTKTYALLPEKCVPKYTHRNPRNYPGIFCSLHSETISLTYSNNFLIQCTQHAISDMVCIQERRLRLATQREHDWESLTGDSSADVTLVTTGN